MRVIAGTYRSRLLAAPPGTSTRPTSDRLRESLFNILAPRLPGCRFVDLFAGTGAVGIEAISRGAQHVWFAEKAAPALKALRQNLSTLKIASGYSVEDRGVMPLLQRLASTSLKVDLVYLDPPYDVLEDYLQTLGFLGSAAGAAMLNPGALLIAEHATRGSILLPATFGRISQTRTHKQGDTTLTFYANTEIPAARK